MTGSDLQEIQVPTVSVWGESVTSFASLFFTLPLQPSQNKCCILFGMEREIGKDNQTENQTGVMNIP